MVEILCVRGADKESLDSKSNPPLWNALKLEYFDIAETIVEQGADLGRFFKHLSFVHQSENVWRSENPVKIFGNSREK